MILWNYRFLNDNLKNIFLKTTIITKLLLKNSLKNV